MDMKIHTEEELMAMTQEELVKMIMEMQKMGAGKCEGGKCTGDKAAACGGAK